MVRSIGRRLGDAHDHSSDAQGGRELRDLELIDTEDLNNIKYVTPAEHNSGERTIQDASDELSAEGVTGAIMLAPGGDYEVGQTQLIDAQSVRHLNGNGARIKVTSDVTAIKLQGNWGSKTSIANSYTRAEYQSEAGPSITNLSVYSDQTPYIGTGIELEGLMNPRVMGCHLFHLDTCLLLSGTDNLRNPIVTNNYIYDSDVGIHLEPGGNMHQMLIQSNIISYHRVAIHLEDHEIDEPLIIGNDIESGTNSAGTDPEHYILVEATNNMARKLKIIANHFEHHHDMVDYAIKITSGSIQTNGLISYIIANNWLDTNSGALLVDAEVPLDGWRVTNNRVMTTAGSGSDLSVRIESSNLLQNLLFGQNSLRDASVEIIGGEIQNLLFGQNSLRDTTVDINTTTDGASSSWSISNNTLWGACYLHISSPTSLNAVKLSNNTVRIEDLDASNLPVFGVTVTGGSAAYCEMSHNRIRGQTLTNGPSTEYVVKWDDSQTDVGTWGLGMESNAVRCFSGNANGVQFVSSSPNSAMIKNNMVYSPNDTPFDVPQDADYVDNGLTKDNIDIS